MQTPAAPSSTTARDALLVALALVTLTFLIVLARVLRKRADAGDSVRPRAPISIISFIANFFDTLGIGSYATTTSMIRQWKIVPDELIPGSMNVGYVIPTVAEAFIYTKSVPVDATTLISMIAASVLGAWLGAGVVSRWPRRKIQIGMGAALIIFAVIMFLGMPQVGLLPTGGDALALTGPKLIFALAGNFMLGALMTLGIGLYAPCMILIYLLGMRPTAAWPIMMGSCAFLMPVASIKFLKTGAYDSRAILGMLLAGIPGVLIAAFVVVSLPLNPMKWLVMVVVTYAAVNLLRAARRERMAGLTTATPEAQPAA